MTYDIDAPISRYSNNCVERSEIDTWRAPRLASRTQAVHRHMRRGVWCLESRVDGVWRGGTYQRHSCCLRET